MRKFGAFDFMDSLRVSEAWEVKIASRKRAEFRFVLLIGTLRAGKTTQTPMKLRLTNCIAFLGRSDSIS